MCFVVACVLTNDLEYCEGSKTARRKRSIINYRQMHSVCFITFVSKVTAMKLPSRLIGEVRDVWITHNWQVTVSSHN